METEDERTEAALRRVRHYVDSWIRGYGERGFLPRMGDLPSLAIVDLKLALEAAEGEHDHALIQLSGRFTEDGFLEYAVIATFPGRRAAEEALRDYGPAPRLRVAFWDDNGSQGTWRW